MTAFSASDSTVYLDALLTPFRTWLDRSDVTEILVNRPGEAWIETAGTVGMTRVATPAIDAQLLERLSQQVARATAQAVNRHQPILAATLPCGARLQFVAPPAADPPALAIRRHHSFALPLEAFVSGPLTPSPPPAWRTMDAAADPLGFLRAAVAQRATILVSGGTSSGKTSLVGALIAAIPADERLIVVEDTPELRVPQPNSIRLVAVKGEMGEARIDTDDLLQAALRMRPDRIILGEMRGREAVTFLRAINTGHPGSLSTIHANSPEGALAGLALLAMQAGLGLSRTDALEHARGLIDVVVQTVRDGSQRRIVDIVCSSR